MPAKNNSKKGKTSVEKGRFYSAQLSDLSNAFESLCHELFPAKTNAYGFSLPALRVMHDY